MQAFHIPAPPPYYTNTFLLISDAGHAVIIDPAADVQNYEQILQEHNAVLTTLLCTHGHFDHVGSAEALRRKYHAVLYCEADDLAGDKMYPLSEADHGYAEGQTVTVDELQFTAWHTPGHTPGSVVLLCGEYLFCGDTLFAGSIGRTDLEGGSSDAMNASLRKLAKLPIPRETQVLPATASFPPSGRNWTTITSSAARCAAENCNTNPLCHGVRRATSPDGRGFVNQAKTLTESSPFRESWRASASLRGLDFSIKERTT